MSNAESGLQLLQESLYDAAAWQEYFLKSQAVLMIIDPQNDVLDERGSLNFWNVWQHARQNNAIENIKLLTKACRSKGIPVIWSKQSRLADSQDVFPGTWDGDFLTLVRMLNPDLFREGTWETEIYEELIPCIKSGDIIVGKQGSNIFDGTQTENYLKKIGARVVITCGFLTDFCVEATMRAACDKGFLGVVVTDVCATESEAIHQNALKRMSRMIGSNISTEDLLFLLESYQPPQASRSTFNRDPDALKQKLANGISLDKLLNWTDYLKPDETALLVVDPQNENLHENGSLNFIGSWRHARDTAALHNLKGLVEACRSRKISVFWTKQNRLPEGRDIFPGSFDSDLMSLIHKHMPGAFLGGTWDTDILDDLKDFIRNDEIVIEKPGWSAFEATPLERYLNTLGIRNLLLCGFLTDFCVESTARSASDRGYSTIIVSDACAAASQEDHDQALVRFNRLIGPVVTTEQVVELLKS